MVTIEFLPKKDLKPGWKGAYLEAMLHRKHVAFNGIEYYRFIKIRQGEIKTLHKYYQNTLLHQQLALQGSLLGCLCFCLSYISGLLVCN